MTRVPRLRHDRLTRGSLAGATRNPVSSCDGPGIDRSTGPLDHAAVDGSDSRPPSGKRVDRSRGVPYAYGSDDQNWWARQWLS